MGLMLFKLSVLKLMPQSSKNINRNSFRSGNLSLVSSSLDLTFPLLLWAEDSVWDVHQPPAGQNPRGDGRPWEDRGQRDGWPDHGGWPGRPRVPPPQDAVLPVHQSSSRRAEREGSWMHCPRTEELRGGRRTREPQNNIPPSQTSLILHVLLGFFVSVLCFGLLRSSCCTYTIRVSSNRRNDRHYPSQNLSTPVISFCPWAIDEEDEEPALDTQQVTLPNLSSLNFYYCTLKWS